MARYIGPKCKLARREGTDLFLKSVVRAIESKCNIEAAPGIPIPPPIKYAFRQLNSSTVKYPTTAPNKPTPATSEVPKALSFFGKLSDTSVIPAPSSPAKPIPAIKRKILYTKTSCTNPQAKFAIE